jgi:uncharacterized protein (UPF0335 family)
MAEMAVIDTDSAKHLVAYIERIERLQEEKKTLAEDIKAEFAAAKGQGFEPKAMKVILKLRTRSADDIQEEENVIDMYRKALGMY